MPSEEQGLKALVSKPNDSPIPKNYPKHGYLKKLSLDPWGNEYQYRYPGEFNEYDVYSLGADGEVGGEELRVDVGSWNIDEAANFLVRYSDDAKRFFQRKLAQKNRAVAVKATANKLSKACFYIMRDKVDYKPDLPFL